MKELEIAEQIKNSKFLDTLYNSAIYYATQMAYDSSRKPDSEKAFLHLVSHILTRRNEFNTGENVHYLLPIADFIPLASPINLLNVKTVLEVELERRFHPITLFQLVVVSSFVELSVSNDFNLDKIVDRYNPVGNTFILDSSYWQSFGTNEPLSYESDMTKLFQLVESLANEGNQTIDNLKSRIRLLYIVLTTFNNPIVVTWDN